MECADRAERRRRFGSSCVPRYPLKRCRAPLATALHIPRITNCVVVAKRTQAAKVQGLRFNDSTFQRAEGIHGTHGIHGHSSHVHRMLSRSHRIPRPPKVCTDLHPSPVISNSSAVKSFFPGARQNLVPRSTSNCGEKINRKKIRQHRQIVPRCN
jgi:hypothetical protein